MNPMFVAGIMNQNINGFYFINSGLEHAVLDVLMILITDLGSFSAWIIACLILFIFGGEKAKKVALLALIALFLANGLVALLKYIVAEPRPFMVLSDVDLLVNESGNSFPSSHSASSFAPATVIGLKYRLKIKNKSFSLLYILIAFAAIIAFSRIYIGVHYPFDVIFGAAIGVICAGIVLKYETLLLFNKITQCIGLDRIMGFNILNIIKNKRGKSWKIKK
jgi:undecaprenyl-diphosphatase